MESLLSEVEVARREIREGRFQRSMALVTAFAAIVSGFEAYMQHQRGAFANRWMWTPVGLTVPVGLAAAGALFSKRIARSFLPVISLVSLLDGAIGFGLHVRGIQRLPGGFKIGQYNVVMGPPVFAPLLLSIVGILGLTASFLRREILPYPPPKRRALAGALGALAARRRSAEAADLENDVAHGRFQQGMALSAVFLCLLSGGEVYFEHLRGSFNQRFMWIPAWATLPMVGVGLAAVGSGWVARALLPFVSVGTFLVGLLGFTLHLRGIKRMPGGFSNLQFNITLGPPLFAPLLFSAVGLLGTLASLLRRRQD